MRLIAIIFSAAIVLQLKAFFVGAVFAAPKPGFNLASKLATIPGRKPRYVIPLDIESYLKKLDGLNLCMIVYSMLALHQVLVLSSTVHIFLIFQLLYTKVLGLNLFVKSYYL